MTGNIMSNSQLVKDEVKNLREDFASHRRDLETRAEKNEKRNQIAQIDQVHIATAVGIITTFATLYASGHLSLDTEMYLNLVVNFETILGLHVAAAILFIPAKLSTMTLSPPVYDSELTRKVNDFVLPALHVFVLWGGLIPALMVFLSTSSEWNLLSGIYFILEIIGLLYPAYHYATGYNRAMSDIKASTTNRVLIPKGGRGETTTRLQLENSSSEAISPDKISIKVDAPEGISVEVGQTRSAPDKDILRPLRELKAKSTVNLPVTIEIDSDQEITDGNIKITTDSPTQTKVSEIVLNEEYLNYQ